MASTNCSGVTADGSYSMVAEPVMRLTVALVTPGAFSRVR
jgi:hypothetical protein